jgi:hypothetical protein
MLMLPFAASDYEIGSRIGEIAGPVLFGLLTFLLVRRARRRPPGRARKTDVIAALLFGAIFVAGLVRLVDHRLGDPWDTQQGKELRAGFIAGCGPNEPLRSSCECLFEQLTSRPAYDTPAKFATLAGPIETAARTGDPRTLPPDVRAAVAHCGGRGA